MPQFTDTIAAIATPPGRGGVGMIRISGNKAAHIAKSLLSKMPSPRIAAFSNFKDESGITIDKGLAIFFNAPNSFTGEDVLELHGHGGPAVMDCLLRRVLALGARMAKPGEFSERAFLNDKIDLVQAEAIADLIDSASEQAVRASVRSLQGEFSKKINFLVESLIKLRMYVEASIDFADEEIDFLSQGQVSTHVTTLIQQIENILKEAVQGSLLRDGITIVISGKPNVGKSTLLNCLCKKDSAIVTDIPGTTRDILREHIVLDGLPIQIIDTAGLRESHDPVEQEGVRRAREVMKQADLILYVMDAREASYEPHEELPRIPVLFVRNKIDLISEGPQLVEQNGKFILSLSAKNNVGIGLLKQFIFKQVGFQHHTEGTFSARRRHLDALTRAQQFLMAGQQQLIASQSGELLAEDLRQAQHALGEITGQVSSDDLLGHIFSQFCIGK